MTPQRATGEEGDDPDGYDVPNGSFEHHGLLSGDGAGLKRREQRAPPGIRIGIVAHPDVDVVRALFFDKSDVTGVPLERTRFAPKLAKTDRMRVYVEFRRRSRRADSHHPAACEEIVRVIAVSCAKLKSLIANGRNRWDVAKR